MVFFKDRRLEKRFVPNLEVVDGDLFKLHSINMKNGLVVNTKVTKTFYGLNCEETKYLQQNL